MKDYTEEELQPAGKIPGEAIDLINCCLERLYKEKHKMTSDEVCNHLTYEELLGALLAAKYEIKKMDEEW